METEPQITFQNVQPTARIKEDIANNIARLEQFHDRIISCRVTIGTPHRHGQKGSLYEVRIDLNVPGGEIVIGTDPGLNHAHEDVHVAIRDAFDAAQRKLEDHVRKHSAHRTRHHETSSHGTVVRLFAEEGYGFIEAEDGHEVYFSYDCVTKNGWAQMDVGTSVRFVEADGDKGPYARTVTLV